MIQKNDIIEIEYTGSLKENGLVFDTTSAEVAQKNNFKNTKAQYKPMKVCVGMRLVLPGLDEALVGKEIGKEYTIEIPTELGFGKKDAKLIQLVSTSKFTKAQIRPMTGLPVTIDNQQGVVRSVSGGRTIVDFNNPLAGKDLIYKFKIIKKIEEQDKQVGILCSSFLGMEVSNITIVDKKATVSLPFDLPVEVQKVLKDKIAPIVKLDDLTFVKQDAKQAVTQ